MMSERTNKKVFVIGGARSGKSSFALGLASGHPGQKAYIATAQAFDPEMKERIRNHKNERGPQWETIEEPLGLSVAIRSASERYGLLLVDCLTLWLSNIMLSGRDVDIEVENLVSEITASGCELITVSNEVGMGIVPENELGRRFRDEAGRLNQKMAAAADEVYLVAAGIPIRIK